MLSRALYRSGQFFRSLRLRVDATERQEAAALLGERLIPLFDSMTPRDQRHCLDVFWILRQRGCEDTDLLIAALLHDAGKGRLAGARIRLWHRVAYVLLAAASPRLLARTANGRGPRVPALTEGLRSLHQHCERGAILAEALGAPAPVVELIARHEEKDAADGRLRVLQAADDAC